MDTINHLIVSKAQSYIGQREKLGNSGFFDEVFDKKMHDVGFVDKEAWCALFAELVWKEAYAEYNRLMVPMLDVIFSKSAVQTLSNFKRSVEFKLQVTKIPRPGALVVWQKYINDAPQWQGHIGIFIEFIGGKMITIEGNTNDIGSREGDGVYKKKRDLNYTNSNGLRLLGFINPKP